MKLITQSIKDGVSLAYISLLIDSTNLFINPLSLTCAAMDKDIDAVLSDITTYTSSLNTLIGSDEISRSKCASKLKAHHKILEDKFKVVNAYSRELNHISTILENKYHHITTRVEDIEGINYHQFIHEGLDFISQAETDDDKIQKTKEFLRFLPMRMTKNSFIDYVKGSLEKISQNPIDPDNKLFLSVFKQLFDGRLTENYGKVFHDIALSVEDLRDRSTGYLTEDSVEVMFDDIYLLKDTLEGLYSIITTLYNAISSLSTLLILENLTFEVLSSEHVAFKDLFFTVGSLLTQDKQSEDYQIMVETLPDRLSNVYDQINEDYTKSTDQFYTKFDAGGFPQTEETVKSIKVFSLTQFYLRLNIEDAFSFSQSTDQSSQLPSGVIKTAIDFLTDQLNTLEPAQRKLRMQYLISMLPFTMDTGTFADYFNGAIEGTSNEVQKAHVLAKISTFMDSFGYFDAHDNH